MASAERGIEHPKPRRMPVDVCRNSDCSDMGEPEMNFYPFADLLSLSWTWQDAFQAKYHSIFIPL